MKVNLMTADEKHDPVLIYPNVKRAPGDRIDPETISKEDIDKIAFHYVKQLIHHITNRGFPIDKDVFRDIDLTYESFKSALLRSVGKYHPLQGYVDELHSLDDADDAAGDFPEDGE